MTLLTTTLVLLALGGLGALFLFLDQRARIERKSSTPDLTGLTSRLEETLAKLHTLEAIERRLGAIETVQGLLPGALKAVRDRIERMFQEFEEKTLSDDSKTIGAQALSRVARMRAEMEKAEEQSLKDFNESANAGRVIPIVARGGV